MVAKLEPSSFPRLGTRTYGQFDSYAYVYSTALGRSNSPRDFLSIMNRMVANWIMEQVTRAGIFSKPEWRYLKPITEQDVQAAVNRSVITYRQNPGLFNQHIWKLLNLISNDRHYYGVYPDVDQAFFLNRHRVEYGGSLPDYGQIRIVWHEKLNAAKNKFMAEEAKAAEARYQAKLQADARYQDAQRRLAAEQQAESQAQTANAQERAALNQESAESLKYWTNKRDQEMAQLRAILAQYKDHIITAVKKREQVIIQSEKERVLAEKLKIENANKIREENAKKEYAEKLKTIKEQRQAVAKFKKQLDLGISDIETVIKLKSEIREIFPDVDESAPAEFQREATRVYFPDVRYTAEGKVVHNNLERQVYPEVYNDLAVAQIASWRDKKEAKV